MAEFKNGIQFHDMPTYKSYSLSDVGNSGIHYLAGFYQAPAAHSILTIGGVDDEVYGTAGRMKSAHAFCVAAGAGGANLVLTVHGISISNAGVRQAGDSEILVPDCDAAVTDQYFETVKKWLGQITYTLTGTAGDFTFNYGFSKADDFGKHHAVITDLEMILHGGANETGFDVTLLHHDAINWTYSADAFVPGGTVICSSLADLSATDNNFDNGTEVSYRRSDLFESINGDGFEGIIIKITTATNNSIVHADFQIGAHIG